MRKWLIKNNINVFLPLILLLVLRVFLQLILRKNGFLALTADDFGRPISSANWLVNSGIPIWNGIWPPFYSYLIAIILSIDWDLYWGPRILSVIVGLISIIFIYKIALKLSGNKPVALFAAFLATINPLLNWISSVPLTENINIMLLLIVILMTYSYFENLKLITLTISAVFLFFANGFRYESWIYSGIFTVFIILTNIYFLKEKIISNVFFKKSVLILLIPWLFPISWMIGNYIYSNNILWFINNTKDYKSLWYGDVRSFIPYLRTFLQIDPISTLIIIPTSVFFFIKNRKMINGLWVLSIAIVPLFVFLILHNGQTEPTGNYLRYLGPYLVFFYPIISTSIFLISKKMKVSLIYRFIFVGLCIVIYTVILVPRIFKVENDPSVAGLSIGFEIQRMNKEAGRSQTYIIERKYWDYLAINTGANDITNIFWDRKYDDYRNNLSIIEIDFQGFLNCIRKINPSYVIVKSDNIKSILEDYFGSEVFFERINGYDFYKIPFFETDSSSKIDACNLPTK